MAINCHWCWYFLIFSGVIVKEPRYECTCLYRRWYRWIALLDKFKSKLGSLGISLDINPWFCWHWDNISHFIGWPREKWIQRGVKVNPYQCDFTYRFPDDIFGTRAIYNVLASTDHPCGCMDLNPNHISKKIAWRR